MGGGARQEAWCRGRGLALEVRRVVVVDGIGKILWVGQGHL